MSLLAEDSVITSATAKKIASDNTAAAKSLLALALHAWILCVLAVVLAALLLLVPAAAVLAFPVAWMAASLYLLCAITARLLAHLPPPDRARELREKSRRQDFVEVDRDEAPGGFDDASSAEGEHGETSERAGGYEFSFGGEDDFGDPCNSFYDLLVFLRSTERRQWR